MSDTAYILGISLGTNTLGWAAIGLKDDAPASILGAGTRVFASDAALIAAGRDEPRNAKRRAARLARRQTARRALRLRKTFQALQQAGLLPAGVAETPWHRRMLLRELDEQISAARPPRDRVEGHLLPYRLRATALHERLEPHELGRALYHLAQRRGFKSNRKAPRAPGEGAGQPTEVAGPVAAGIEELRKAMSDGGFPTLGSYFASLDPEERRIRHRWTDRRMLEDELDAIWSAQAPLHQGLLTDELRTKLHRIIFRQRQLKTPRRMRCEIEPNCRRAALEGEEAPRHRHVASPPLRHGWRPARFQSILPPVVGVERSSTRPRRFSEQVARRASTVHPLLRGVPGRREAPMTDPQDDDPLGLMTTPEGEEGSLPPCCQRAVATVVMAALMGRMRRLQDEELSKMECPKTPQ